MLTLDAFQSADVTVSPFPAGTRMQLPRSSGETLDAAQSSRSGMQLSHCSCADTEHKTSRSFTELQDLGVFQIGPQTASFTWKSKEKNRAKFFRSIKEYNAALGKEQPLSGFG